jgi:dihydroorotase
VAFSDAERPIANSELLRRALQYCLMFDKPILNRPESVDLTHGGVMHEGLVSLVLGLATLSADAEDVMTARDLRLAEITGGRLHLMSISTAASVELIRRAKSRGIRITSEVCPANFTLTDERLRSFDANYKVNPPLRSQEHVDACVAGLRDGTIDVIASGHAPRATEKKMQELDQAPFGVIGLETMLALVITRLVEPGHLDWPTALSKMTANPARILGLPFGTLQIGAEADITIIDPRAEWTVSAEQIHSQSTNTPFLGWKLKGRATHTIVGGEVKFSLG